MADEQTTHAVYKGRHYVLPGSLTPQEALLRVKNLTADGPKLSRGPESSGFEDTSAEASAILNRYHEPNRARDVLPELAKFGILGLLPGQVGKGAMALRGLSAADKVRRVVSGGAKLAGVTAAGVAADQTLQAAGVPPILSEIIVGAAGLSTKPGRQAVRAGLEALASREAATTAPATVRAVPGMVSSTASTVRFPGAASMPGRMPPAAAGAAPVSQAATAPALAPPATELEAQLQASIAAIKTPEQQQAFRLAGEIADKIVEWKGQGLSGAQMQSALRNVYGIEFKDGRAMVQMVLDANGLAAAKPAAARAVAPKAVPAEVPMRGPRIEVGAQRVGREAGLSKEEVRKATGPVLDEELGEASPILPKKALQSIIDTMKKLPMSEREAYVARATSGKAKWQIENIRRTLEHLGLLLPVGAAAAASRRKAE